MDNFLAQLRHRQVFKVATIYAVSAWPLIQIADLAVPALGLPDSVMTVLLQSLSSRISSFVDFFLVI